MKLSQLNKGQRALIKDISLPEELKQRLQSMGLVKNEVVYVCRVGFMKGSFYLKFSCDSCIIISKNEAEHIEVELLEGKQHRYRWGRKNFQDSCQSCCQDEE